MHFKLKNLIIFSLLSILLCSGFFCDALETGKEPADQGKIVQLKEGDLHIFLNNKGFSSNLNITKYSAFIAYVFVKGGDFKQPCPTDGSSDQVHCVDSFGFSNDPGYFGYNKDFQSYGPSLQDSVLGPTKLDGFYCYPLGSSQWNCGFNRNPIQYLDLSSNQYLMRVIAADGSGYASIFQQEYNGFQSLNHIVNEGDRFDVYLAVHYNATQEADTDYGRFLKNSSIWQRPIVPDLISPKVSIKIKLSAEGPTDTAGNTYDIPDFSTWVDPFAECRGSNTSAGELVISELVWAGSQENDLSTSSTDEYIEIFNRSGRDLILSDYKIESVKADSSSAWTIILPKCLTVKGNDDRSTTNKDERIIVIGEKTTGAFPTLEVADTTISLSNSEGRKTILKNKDGVVLHELDCTSYSAWPGGSSASPRTSMVQSASPPIQTPCTSGWSSSTSASSNVASTHNSNTYASPGTHP